MTVSVSSRHSMENTNATVLAVGDQSGAIALPPGINMLTAQFMRHGDDLELVLENGQHVVLTGFFANGTGHDLIMPNGAMISAHGVAVLAGPLAPGQFAQAEGGGHDGLIQVGMVDKLVGTATVKHADGTTEPLAQGTIVYQDDVIETGNGASVGLIFADSSTFSLGSSGRMILDEVLYDPGDKSGHAALEVVSGSFSLVSGQIAKSSPNAMSVKTPVMTIGVRGTTVAGQVNDAGETSLALLQDSSGNVGQVTVQNAGGLQVISQPNSLVTLSSFTQAPPPPTIVPASTLMQTFGDSVRTLPVPPPPGTLEWSTKPGAQQQAPVQQIQSRPDANKVVDPTSPTGTKEAPAATQQDGAKTETKTETKAETKTEAKTEATATTETKAEAKTEAAAAATATETKAETKAETETKAEVETKVETKVEAETKVETTPTTTTSTTTTSFLNTTSTTTTNTTTGTTASTYLTTVTDNKFVEAATGTSNSNSSTTTSSSTTTTTSTKETTDSNNTSNDADTAAKQQEAEDAAAAAAAAAAAEAENSGNNGNNGNHSGSDNTTSSGGSSGKVIDGAIIGAKVFRDMDGDYTWDADEVYTFSTSDGSFSLSGSGGVIVAQGGTDSVTGLTLTTSMVASSTSSVVSPLTTLISMGMSESALITMLGLPAGTDIDSLDPTTNATAQAMSTKVLAAVQAMYKGLASQGSTVTSTALFDAVADKLVADGGTTDLTATATFTAILSTASGTSASDPAIISLGSIAATAAVTSAAAVSSGNYDNLQGLMNTDFYSIVSNGTVLNPSTAASTYFLSTTTSEDIGGIDIAHADIFTASTTSVVISDIPTGSTVTLNGSPLTVTSGSVTLDSSQVSLIVGGQTLEVTPPANMGIDFTLNFSATRTGPTTATYYYVINELAVSDAPTLSAPATVTGDVNTAIDISAITVGNNDTTGSPETIWLVIAGVPTGATVQLGNTTLTATSGSLTLTAAQLLTISGSNKLTVTPPLNSTDDFTLSLTAYSKDGTATAMTANDTIDVVVNEVTYSFDMSASTNPTLTGTSVDETFTMTITDANSVTNNVTLIGGGGNDILDVSGANAAGEFFTGYTRSGNNLVMHFDSGSGDRTVTFQNQFDGTGNGIDKITYDNGYEYIAAGLNNAADTRDLLIVGTTAGETLTGGTGENEFFGLGGSDTFYGGSDYDTVSFQGQSTAIIMSGLLTDDGTSSSITVTQGSDTLYFSNINEIIGTSGHDILYGWNRVSSSGGNNYFALNGGAGNDSLYGGSNHTVFADYDHDPGKIIGSFTWQGANIAGTVIQMASNGTTTLASDSLSQISHLQGSRFNDTITVTVDGGYSGNGFFFDGGAGDDSLTGSASAWETIGYGDAESGVVVNLDTGTATDGLGGTDTFSYIDGVVGSDFADTLTGSSGNNALQGGAGNDTITTGNGNDSIHIRDNGATTLAALEAAVGSDVILDFTAGSDVLYLSGTMLSNMGGMGVTLTAIGSTAQNLGVSGAGLVSRVVGNTSYLYYTSDLSAVTSSNSVQIARVDGVSDMNYGNISIDGTPFSPISYSINFAHAISDYTLSTGSGTITITDSQGERDGSHLFQAAGGSDLVFSDTTVSLGMDGDLYVDDDLGDDSSITVGDLGMYTIFRLGDGDDSLDVEATTTGSSLSFSGGMGNDTLHAGTTLSQTFNGGDNTDTLDFDNFTTSGVEVNMVSHTATSSGYGDASISFSNVEIIKGSGMDDLFIVGTTGTQTFYGGVGADSISFSGYASGVTFNAESGATNTINSNAIVANNIETAIGSNYNDTFTAASTGSTLYGGQGSDTLTGGAGADVFAFGSATQTLASSQGTDMIYNFDSLNDKIVLSLSMVTDKLGALGAGDSPNNVHYVEYTSLPVSGTLGSGGQIGTDGAIIVIGDTTGTAGVDVYYVNDVDLDSNTSYQLAHIDGINLNDISNTNIVVSA